MLGWMKQKLESRLLGEINNLRYADDITLMAESKEELKSLLKQKLKRLHFEMMYSRDLTISLHPRLAKLLT